VFAVVGLAAATMGWWVRGVPRWLLGTVLVIGLGGAIASTLVAVDGYPWSNLLVLAVALAAGVLLGGAIPAGARSMLLVLTVLAVLDAAQLLFVGGTEDNPSESWFYLLVRGPEGNLFKLGVADLVLVVTMAVHGGRRELSFWPAILPGPVGLLVAFAYSSLLRPPGGLVLVPFLLIGWVLVELWVRRGTKEPTSSA
jgi:hypothetical protein